MLKKKLFRTFLVISSLILFSFTKKNELQHSNALRENETARRFFGWGCPSCTVDPNGNAGQEWVCVSTYYVLGIGVNSSTCYCTTAYDNNGCSNCNNSNLNCGSTLAQ